MRVSDVRSKLRTVRGERKNRRNKACQLRLKRKRMGCFDAPRKLVISKERA